MQKAEGRMKKRFKLNYLLIHHSAFCLLPSAFFLDALWPWVLGFKMRLCRKVSVRPAEKDLPRATP
jgi:hypothetical protein